jgi:cellulose synthase (UDP-forming)
MSINSIPKKDLDTQLTPIYEYINNLWAVKIFNLVALILLLIGISNFFIFSIYDPLVLVIFILPMIIYITTQTISYGINLFYPRFDIESHRLLQAKITNQKNKPSVDIFLPICGELIDTLDRTFRAVSKINYDNFQVYIGDDTKNPDQRSVNESLAQKYGFNYHVRENIGEFKKAGNLNYLLTKSNGEIIVIFDADFAPNKEFLNHTVGYFEYPNLGFLQTPQYFQLDDKFHKNNMFGYGAGYIQEEFYRFIQPARATFNSTVCVGSNSLYNRSNLLQIGGFANVDHSEDIVTGIRFQASRFKTMYLPLILASGKCPDNIDSYISQQIRWALGSLELMFSKEFWYSNLSISQKLNYGSGYLFYLNSLTEKILYLLPFVAFFRDIGSDYIFGLLLFLPYFMFIKFIKPMILKYPETHYSDVIDNLTSFIRSYAVATYFAKINYSWKASGAKTKNQADRLFLIFLSMFLIIYIAFIIVSVMFNSSSTDLLYWPLWIWLGYPFYKLLKVYRHCW